MIRVTIGLVLLMGLLVNQPLWAEDEASTPAEMTNNEASSAPTEVTPLYARIQARYKLTPEDTKLLEQAKLPEPGAIQAAHLAAGAKKPLAEILKMRTERKLGWGNIAKELGVDPGELGKSVAEFRHQRREELRHQKGMKDPSGKAVRSAERHRERIENRSERANGKKAGN